MIKLQQQLNEVSPISEEVWQILLDKWTHQRQLKRHEMLSKLGERERYLYFVHSGEMKICYPADGDEICAGFAYTDNVICSYPSFIANAPSQYYIQAITPCEVTGILREDFYTLVEQYRELERCWRKLTELALMGRMERELEILTMPPIQKFERLMARSPHIFNLIPQKYLASYLGMSPETFSRVKRQYLKRKRS